MGGYASLVVSLWMVNDRSTAQLMCRFYQGLRDGLTKAQRASRSHSRSESRFSASLLLGALHPAGEVLGRKYSVLPSSRANLTLHGFQLQLAWRVSLYAWHPVVGISRQALDDAPVRGLRFGSRNKPTLQVSSRERTNRTFRCLRSSDADGHGLGSSSGPWRSREGRCRDRYPAGHGDLAERHSARPRLHLDDDQCDRCDPSGDVRDRCEEARRCRQRRCTAQFRTTF